MESVTGKWSIATYLRIKPVAQNEVPANYTVEEAEDSDGRKRSVLDLQIPLDNDQGIIINNSKTGRLRFEYDHVFDKHENQEDVFNLVVRDKITGIMEGISCTIFAYGQTGSGKTYTIFGGDSFSSRGLIPRTLTFLFQKINATLAEDNSFSFTCQISFTEIYKESVFDLLDNNRPTQNRQEWTPVQMMEGENGLILRNLNVFRVNSEEEALQLFFMGNKNRLTSATVMNTMSSRSHAVFTILIGNEGLRSDRTVLSAAKMNLVDLAGSERMYKMDNSKSLIKEAKAINLSLHYLEQVIITLRDQALHVTNKKSGYVPYRNSALTIMLRDSLGGNCRSCFIMAINPDINHFEESLATCRFGERCGEVRVEVTANSEVSLIDQVRDLQARVKLLERQLYQVDSDKQIIQEELQREKHLRMLHTGLRTLTSEEHTTCKNCVQLLLAAAKESMLISNNPNSAVNVIVNSSGKTLAEEVLEKSQDKLFETVQMMDKAVLVELSTALGGLIQSMYIERETSKFKQQLEENHQKTVSEQRRVKETQDRLHAQLIMKGDRRSILEVPSLPEALKDVITKGALFVKHSWYGKEIRFISANDLLTHLQYKSIKAKEKDSTGSYLIKSFESVVEPDEKHPLELHLIGRPGQKSVHLEYANGSSEDVNQRAVLLWVAALKYLVYNK